MCRKDSSPPSSNLMNLILTSNCWTGPWTPYQPIVSITGTRNKLRPGGRGLFWPDDDTEEQHAFRKAYMTKAFFFSRSLIPGFRYVSRHVSPSHAKWIVQPVKESRRSPGSLVGKVKRFPAGGVEMSQEPCLGACSRIEAMLARCAYVKCLQPLGLLHGRWQGNLEDLG